MPRHKQTFPGKLWTWDIVMWNQLRCGKFYNAGLDYAPDAKLNDDCYAHFMFADERPQLEDAILSYIGGHLARGADQDEFSLVNYPLSNDAHGGTMRTVFSMCGELYGVQPLPEDEFAHIQTVVQAQYPLVWGLPGRPNSDIPIITEAEASAAFDDMMVSVVDVVQRFTGRNPLNYLPPDMQATYLSKKRPS